MMMMMMMNHALSFKIVVSILKRKHRTFFGLNPREVFLGKCVLYILFLKTNPKTNMQSND
jgi:hypothetical protein